MKLLKLRTCIFPGFRTLTTTFEFRTRNSVSIGPLILILSCWLQVQMLNGESCIIPRLLTRSIHTSPTGRVGSERKTQRMTSSTLRMSSTRLEQNHNARDDRR